MGSNNDNQWNIATNLSSLTINVRRTRAPDINYAPAATITLNFCQFLTNVGGLVSNRSETREVQRSSPDGSDFADERRSTSNEDFKMFTPQGTIWPSVEGEYYGAPASFHCTKCSYICYDSVGIGSHRRKHMIADSLSQTQFRKVRLFDSAGVMRICNCCVRCKSIVQNADIENHMFYCRIYVPRNTLL